MKRNLLWMAVPFALAIALPLFQHQAAGQESGEGSAAASADAGQADAGAAADASGSAAADQPDAPSSATGGVSTQSDSSARSSGGATTRGEAGARSETSGRIDAEGGRSRTSDARSDADRQDRSLLNETQRADDRDAATGDRARAGVSARGRADLDARGRADLDARGRADLDARGRDGRQHDFRRGIQFGRATDRGLSINQIERNSIYYDSGFRRGDVIVSLYGRPIRSEADFLRYVVLRPGRPVPVVVLRDGRRETIYIEYPQEVVHRSHVYDDRRAPSGGAYLGVVFDAEYRDAAVVNSVKPGSPAEEAGLQPGDLILALNEQEVRSYPDAISMIRSMRPGEELEIIVERARSERQIVAVLDAQPNVRTATRPAETGIERQQIRVDQPADVQIDVDRRDFDDRRFGRDRDTRGRDRRLLPRLRD